MRISRVNNNNIQNFTALRLKPGAEKYISSLPKKTLLQLDEIGEMIRDTEFYHLDIAKDFYISHVNGERLYPPYSINLAGKSLVITARQGITPAKKIIKFDTNKQAIEAKEKISNTGTHLGHAGYITKFLDVQEKKFKLKNMSADKITPDDTHENIIAKLINKYSV